MDAQQDQQSKLGQYVVWCAVLLLANLIVGIMALVKLGEIADALGA